MALSALFAACTYNVNIIGSTSIKMHTLGDRSLILTVLLSNEKVVKTYQYSWRMLQCHLVVSYSYTRQPLNCFPT